MSTFNNGNRPQQNTPLAAITSTRTITFFLAGKKVIIRGLKLLSTVAIVTSNANFLTFQLKKLVGARATDIGDSFDTTAGIAAGDITEIVAAKDFVLRENESLQLEITETGAVSWGGNLLSTDYEVVGN